MDLLCRLLVSIEMTPPTDSGLYVDGCVCALVGRMSEDRLALIRQVTENMMFAKRLFSSLSLLLRCIIILCDSLKQNMQYFEAPILFKPGGTLGQLFEVAGPLSAALH